MRRESTMPRTRRESRSEPSQKNNTPTTQGTARSPFPTASVGNGLRAVPNERRAVSNEFNDVLRTLDAGPDDSSRDSQGAASSGWLSGLWLVIKLAIVVGLIYLTVYVLKLWMAKKPFTLGMAAKGDIKVLETVGLGPNRALHLVTIGEQKLLLASTANAVQLICEVESPAAPALAAAPPTANGASPQFAAALRALQEVAGNNEDAAEIAAFSNGRDGRALLREKILKLRESS
jgi:flagellar biogenesis protein FliO